MRADVVVVGAGAAGCVVGARLSERRDLHVVLAEAGTDDAVVPWPDLSVLRTRQQQPTAYTAGLGVGGSAALNAMVATVGEPDDYDEWERGYGCAGWSWRDVRPWFRRVALPMRAARRSELGPLSSAVLATAPGAARAKLTRTRDGQRAGVKEVYLAPARSRGNLQVRANAKVDRVLLDGYRAVGVALTGGETIDAATVVVCAGALHTPLLLGRSGVEREGIGVGLHDHPSLSIPLVGGGVVAGDDILPVTVVARATHANRNDVQVVPIDSPAGPALMVAAMRVHSRGHVRANAEFDMLADERDVVLLRGAVSTALSWAAHQTLRRVGVAVEPAIDDIALGAAVGDYFHAAGSCRMGAASDPMAVVDSWCRVIGYEALLVCDASVMPNLPRANPCVPTVMIAERVASFLRA